jgi:hypothetical protein
MNPCDQDIFKHGRPICLIDGRSWKVEKTVKEIAERTGLRVDWHMSGGVAQVLFLGGDKEQEVLAKEFAAVKSASTNGWDWDDPDRPITVLKVFHAEAKGLYRAGVTPTPEGAIGAFHNPDTGDSTFMVQP